MNRIIKFSSSHLEQLADNVLAYITNEMKSLDGAFKSMYRGPKISGSYADDLKISKPNEFDFLLRIKLPQMNNFKVHKTVNVYAICIQSYFNILLPFTNSYSTRITAI